MKTVYIPLGETVNYETLVTENLVVKGCLNVVNGVKAKNISGDGVICAGEISADSICAYELEAATVICKRLIAERVSAAEVFASACAVVSRFLYASYVETGKLTVAISEIDEIKADEVVNLPAKKRGMLATLIASAWRSFWAALTTPDKRNTPVDADYEPVGGGAKQPDEHQDGEASEPAVDADMKAEIAKTVQEILAQERAAKDDEAGETDFELKRFINIFQLCRDSGFTLRVVPGTPEENAPVFDFDTEQIIRPAA